jgi:glucose-1-phosphate thymidylyltransferase
MKVIIPVAGFGTRLRPHTLTTPKVMLNVAGKPMIHYIVEQLLNDKIGDEIVFITGYLGNKIEEYLNSEFAAKTASGSKVKLTYITQDEPKGLGHAIYCAKPAFDKNEETLIILGDTLFDVDLKRMTGNEHSVIGVKQVDDPRRFGVVEKGNDGFVTRFVEKPASKEVSPSNEAIVGLYYLKNSDLLFSSLEYVMQNNITVKGEFQLTDALEKMVREKEKITTFNVEGWLDCGKPETLLETNRYLLENKVKAGGKESSGSIIIEPVFIGEGVVLENSVIGPYATINDKCKIKNSVIRDSIINKDSRIENAVLSESILGESSTVIKPFSKLNLGDFSEG